MNQHAFTPALAEQHRSDLMASARHARDRRMARSARRGFRLRLRPKRARQTTARPVTAPVHLADAV